MQHHSANTLTAQSRDTLLVNSVIRNTYILLGSTLVFSGFTAWIAMASNARPMGLFSLIIYFGLFFVTHKLRNSSWGLVAIFALTGFMGYTLGPILNYYIGNFVNGSELVMSALGLTGAIFFALSGYALTTRKNFSLTPPDKL